MSEIVHYNASKRVLEILKLLFSLPHFDNIAVRVTNVTANLDLMSFWLGKEFSPLLFPLLVTGPDVCHTNNHKITNFAQILRCSESDRWLIVCRTSTFVKD